MFPLRKSRTSKIPQTEWGIKELIPTRKGIIYHAAGKLQQSSGFAHVLLLADGRAADFSQTNDERNRSAVEAIFRDEQRERLRGAAPYVFGNKPNYGIAFYADPVVGKRRKLLERGLCLNYPGYHAPAIGIIVCRFLVATASGIDYTNLPWLIQEDEFTCRFWHSAVLVAYVRAIFGGDR